MILIERLLHELTIQIPEVKTGGKLLGSSFCVTGTFSTHSRDDIHDMIEKNGGEVRSSVSTKLTYLIAGESAGSKLEKARECGVQIVTLDEFLNMVV